MSLDPATVTLDQLEKPGPHDVPARIVGRYTRAVVVETDLTTTQLRYTVWALADIDTGPYDRPVAFRGLTGEWAHQLARDWTRLATQTHN